PSLLSNAVGLLCAHLAAAPFVHHGFFADGSALTMRHSKRGVLHWAPQEGLNVAAEWANEYFVKAYFSSDEALPCWYRGPPSRCGTLSRPLGCRVAKRPGYEQHTCRFCPHWAASQSLCRLAVILLRFWGAKE
ncbi:Tbingi protein, partial [Trypanosoma rangeli]